MITLTDESAAILIAGLETILTKSKNVNEYVRQVATRIHDNMLNLGKRLLTEAEVTWVAQNFSYHSQEIPPEFFTNPLAKVITEERIANLKEKRKAAREAKRLVALQDKQAIGVKWETPVVIEEPKPALPITRQELAAMFRVLAEHLEK